MDDRGGFFSWGSFGFRGRGAVFLHHVGLVGRCGLSSLYVTGVADRGGGLGRQ